MILHHRAVHKFIWVGFMPNSETLNLSDPISQVSGEYRSVSSLLSRLRFHRIHQDLVEISLDLEGCSLDLNEILPNLDRFGLVSVDLKNISSNLKEILLDLRLRERGKMRVRGWYFPARHHSIKSVSIGFQNPKPPLNLHPLGFDAGDLPSTASCLDRVGWFCWVLGWFG